MSFPRDNQVRTYVVLTPAPEKKILFPLFCICHPGKSGLFCVKQPVTEVPGKCGSCMNMPQAAEQFMIHLVFSILSSTAILMIFRSLDRFRIDLFVVIILNYITSSLLGMILVGQGPAGYYLGMIRQEWFFLSAFIGVLLIVTFFMIGISAQKAGLTATTVSTRMSVAIPMVFSILYYAEPVNPLKWTGIALAVAALFLTAVREKSPEIPGRYLYLPIALFLSMGTLDAIVKYTQQTYITGGIAGGDSALFTGAAFTWAFVSGLVVCGMKKARLKSFFSPGVLTAGILLGTCNFGSMFFMINALNSRVFESAIIFGMNSIGIVCLSVFLAIVLFREKLRRMNWAGVGLAACATLVWIYA